MTIEFKVLPGEPILIQKNGADYVFEKEGHEAAEQVVRLLNAQPQPVVFIMDLSAVSNISMEDLAVGSNVAIEQFSMFKHPKMKACIVVSTNKGLMLAAKGLDSEAFGNTRLLVAATSDEALAQARAINQQ